MGWLGVTWAAANRGRSSTWGKKLNSAWMRELVIEESTPPHASDQSFYCFLHSCVKILGGQTTVNTVVLFLVSAESSNENSDGLISRYYVNVWKITVVDV